MHLENTKRRDYEVGSLVGNSAQSAAFAPQPIRKFEFHGLLSAGFLQAIYATKFPAQTGNFIQAHSGRIIIADYYTRALPGLANQVTPKTEDDERTHANHCAGGFHSPTKNIIVAECYLDSEFCGLTYRSPEKTKNPLMWQINERPAQTLRHEIGHLFDYLMDWISVSPGFQKAWLQDVEELGGEDAVRAIGLGYYIQNGVKGRREVFTELWAHEHGGGLRSQSDHSIHGNFRECHKWVIEFIGHFELALKRGDKHVWNLARDYHYQPRATHAAAVHNMKYLVENKKFNPMRRKDFFQAGLKLCEHFLAVNTPDAWEIAFSLAQSVMQSRHSGHKSDVNDSVRGHVNRAMRLSGLDKDRSVTQAVDAFYSLRMAYC